MTFYNNKNKSNFINNNMISENLNYLLKNDKNNISDNKNIYNDTKIKQPTTNYIELDNSLLEVYNMAKNYESTDIKKANDYYNYINTRISEKHNANKNCVVSHNNYNTDTDTDNDIYNNDNNQTFIY